MPLWLDLAIAGVLLTNSIYLLAAPKRRRSASVRFRPHRMRQVGDEAEEWLNSR
jgi:hypothetical protein